MEERFGDRETMRDKGKALKTLRSAPDDTANNGHAAHDAHKAPDGHRAHDRNAPDSDAPGGDTPDSDAPETGQENGSATANDCDDAGTLTEGADGSQEGDSSGDGGSLPDDFDSRLALSHSTRPSSVESGGEDDGPHEVVTPPSPLGCKGGLGPSTLRDGGKGALLTALLGQASEERQGEGGNEDAEDGGADEEEEVRRAYNVDTLDWFVLTSSLFLPVST